MDAVAAKKLIRNTFESPFDKTRPTRSFLALEKEEAGLLQQQFLRIVMLELNISQQNSEWAFLGGVRRCRYFTRQCAEES